MKNKLFTKITSFVLALVLMLSINIVSFSAYAQGTGTESDPYLITTPEELQNINNDPSASYKLAANIDLNNMDFVPIGNAESGAFSGTFDGAGFTISNLNVFAGKYAGLFGCNEGVIKNVTLDNIYVYGNRYIGGVCAQNTSYGTVENCTVLGGLVESNGGINDIAAAGVIGCNEGDVVGPFENRANLKVTNDFGTNAVGGIIGLLSNDIILYANNFGDLSLTYNPSTLEYSYLGGLIGYIDKCNSVEIRKSYNCGNISANGNTNARTYASGLVGSENDVSGINIDCSYNSGGILSSAGVGYAAGIILGSANISQCYNSGEVVSRASAYNWGYYDSYSYGLSSSANVVDSFNLGNIIIFEVGSCYGITGGNVENCYNLGTLKTSTDQYGGSAYALGGTVNNSYQLKEAAIIDDHKYIQGTYVDISQFKSMIKDIGWDFDKVWQIDENLNGGLPILKNIDTSLSLNVSNQNMKCGSELQLTAYKNGQITDDIEWVVVDGDVKVDENGLVTASEIGHATISAVDKDGYRANFNTYVYQPAASVSMTNRILKINENETSNSPYCTINGSDSDFIVEWSSDNEDVVKVDQIGNLTPVTVGTATITAKTLGGTVGTQKVTVVNTATSLSLPTSSTVARGSQKKITATVSPDPTSSKITWTSSDDGVASVDQNGNVTGVSIGQAVITAATDNGYSDTCTVTVNAPVTSMQFERPSVTIYKNDTDKLNLITDPADTTDTISYSSSSSSYVTVSSDGTITSKSSARTVTITATAASGVKAYCTVTVIDQPVPVTSVTLDSNAKSVQAGEVFKLAETILPENATNKSVHWSSTDESVATVNQDGTVTAVAEGKVVITVESENGALDYCEVTVSGPNSKNLSKIYIPEIIETSEEYVDIPVIIENNLGINFASLSIMYDSAVLEPVSVSNGKVFGSVLGSIDKENSLVKLCFTSEENVTENGQLAVIKFKVIGESGQDTPVKVCYFPDEIRNAANEAVAFNIFDGAVNIIAHEHTYGTWVYNGDAVYNSSSDYKNGTQTRKCTVCGESETIEAPNTALLRRRGNSIALESSITLTTYITKDVVDYYDEVYAEFTRNGKTEKVYASDELLNSGSAQYYIFEYSGISPQAMIDDVEITFYGIKDGVKYWGDTYTYSITDYVKTTLAKPDSTDELKTMLVDLMYYGAACQTYQNYKTDQLMTDILTEEQKQYKSTYELELNNIKDTSYQTCENRLVRFGTTLRLNDAVEMAIALNMTDVSIEDLTFKVKVGTRELTYTYAENPENFEKGADGYWYFYFDGVYAHQMNEEVFITAYQGNEQVSYTLRYSIESYAAIVTDAKLKAVTDAMMYYGNSAKAYAG